MTSNPDSGIVTVPANHTVDETVAKLEGMLQAKGQATSAPKQSGRNRRAMAWDLETSPGPARAILS